MIATADSRDTIVAIASPPSPAIRGIVRISGPEAVAVLQSMAAAPLDIAGSRPRRIEVAVDLGEPLGTVEAVALVWPGRQSYTGAPSIELHTVGAIPILEAAVAAAVRAGARPARPGEFTMRAFLAGRMDLTQAEAVLGVIDAVSRDQLDAALSQLAGNVSEPLRRVRSNLLDLLADVEAGLDFVEEDISFISDEAIAAALRSAESVIAEAQARIGERHRSVAAIDVILRGEPNAGKSSLLNALAGAEAALVSDTAGTTRDVVLHELSLDGRTIRLVDTAGNEADRDEIMRQSRLMAEESQKTAAVTLWCAIGSDPVGPPRFADGEPDGGSAAAVLRVATQADRLATPERQRLSDAGWIVTSALTGEGLEELRRRILGCLDQAACGEHGVQATAARCSDAIRRAAEAIRAAGELLSAGEGHEWVSSEIRLALAAIGEVTGEIYTDDILDRVFSRFCIGK